MANSNELEKFDESHPYPEKIGIQSLFRFYSIDLNHVDRLEHLFINKKLYHALPSQFNDPFECRPYYKLPQEPNKINIIRQHLIKILIEGGKNRKEAESLVSDLMKNPKLLEKMIRGELKKGYAQWRICCFTTRKENLLFWSHYADSHKGFCVEFDAIKKPISYSLKVQYQINYPRGIYPIPHDVTAYRPALIKSSEWNYEEEFRSIFFPEAENQPENKDGSLILQGDEIKNVYLGAKMDEKNKKTLLDKIEKGNFNPDIWVASLAESEFKLEFTRIKKKENLV